MLQSVCLWLAPSYGNSNTIQLQSLQFAVCPIPLVYSVHFPPRPQSAIHSLRFTRTEEKTKLW